MDFLQSLSFVTALICFGCGFAILCIKRSSLSWIVLGSGFLLLAFQAVFNGLILDALSEPQLALWYKWRLYTRSLLPFVWLLVSLCFARGNFREFVKSWRIWLLFALVIPLLTLLFLGHDLLGHISVNESSGTILELGKGGKLISTYVLIASLGVLMNFERTFRSAIGVMRWRVKFFVLGAAIYFGAEVYSTSQSILYSAVHNLSFKIGILGLFIGTIFMAYSLVRTKLDESELYPSRKVLQNSITFGFAAVYLLCVGLLAQLAKFIGADQDFPIKALFLMLAVIGVTVLMLSDRMRQYVALFVSRNLRRPVYDYRKIWSHFTERTGSIVDRTAFCREVVQLLADTFETLSVTLWISQSREKQFHFIASTAITEKTAADMQLTSDEMLKLFEEIRHWNDPRSIETETGPAGQILKKIIPDHFSNGGNRLCVSLFSGGELLGFLTLADRVNGSPYTLEDYDLLKCLADEIANRLRNFELAQQLLQNKEIEAFQAMSAFFVHDLKNTVSTLSLMLQNISKHFGDPMFREDCEKSLSRSVSHINGLISRLAMLRHELQLKKAAIDLNQLLENTLNELQELPGINVQKEFQEIPKINGDAEQLKKVITNLLLNAREAVNGNGNIVLQTGITDGLVRLTVVDNGIGMKPEFIRNSLFKPFQSTKKNGLGIGMFHTKVILDAHQARIEVKSEQNKGTTFKLTFPTI